MSTCRSLGGRGNACHQGSPGTPARRDRGASLRHSHGEVQAEQRETRGPIYPAPLHVSETMDSAHQHPCKPHLPVN